MLEQRRELFRSIGDRLSADLRAAAEGATDTGVQGAAGEEYVRSWLSQQLPKRFEVATGAVLSSDSGPTGQLDCLIVDGDQSPAFRQIGGRPDLFPIEGIVASIEVNTGRSGATYAKLLRDASKLSELGKLRGRPPLPKAVQLEPMAGGVPTLESAIFVARRRFPMQPLLLIFAERLQGSLRELTTRLASHNKSVSISESVDAVFIVDKGFVSHLTPGQGWNVQRLAGFPLGWIEAEPWEVLLKLMTMIWNYLWKGPCEFGPDVGAYYADKAYFLDQEQPRLQMLEDPDYLAQTEPGFITYQA